jgi:hypothetical protein
MLHRHAEHGSRERSNLTAREASKQQASEEQGEILGRDWARSSARVAAGNFKLGSLSRLAALKSEVGHARCRPQGLRRAIEYFRGSVS